MENKIKKGTLVTIGVFVKDRERLDKHRRRYNDSTAIILSNALDKLDELELQNSDAD